MFASVNLKKVYLLLYFVDNNNSNDPSRKIGLPLKLMERLHYSQTYKVLFVMHFDSKDNSHSIIQFCYIVLSLTNNMITNLYQIIF